MLVQCGSTEPARWIEDAVDRSSIGRVRNYVPVHLSNMARILHKAGEDQNITWNSLIALDEELTGDVQYECIVAPSISPPGRGGLDPTSMEALQDILLSIVPREANMYVGSWVGHQGLNSGDATYFAPRQCILYRCRREHLRAGAEALRGYLYNWFDESKSWIVISEIDFDSTLVAGPNELMDRIYNCPQLEVVRVDLDTDLTLSR